jgi:hypothetical protein
MRVTIDMPDDLYQIVLDMARDNGQTFSQTVTELVRRGLQSPEYAAYLNLGAGSPHDKSGTK